jgi:hypothetical protein
MSAKPYTFIADPGHGWLAVPVKELRDLGIIAKISPYSYLKDGIAYLEEDCDLAVFFYAKKWTPEEYRQNVREEHQDPCPIRNYRSFTSVAGA